jgi:tyrosine-protein phosphatase YwqE
MNLFKNIFSNKTDNPIDLSVLGTDMHSHLIPGIDDGAQTIEESIELIRELRAALKNEGIKIEIDAAAEYLIDDKFEEKLKSGNLLTFSENYILIELSFFSPHPNLLSYIFDLQIAGYKVILAHPERYSYWFDNFIKFKDLKDRGVFFQINIISLGGYYSFPVKKIAEKLINNNMIEFLGTDMHNPNYMQGLKQALNEKYLDKILSSGKLLNSQL